MTRCPRCRTGRHRHLDGGTTTTRGGAWQYEDIRLDEHIFMGTPEQQRHWPRLRPSVEAGVHATQPGFLWRAAFQALLRMGMAFW